MARHVESVGKQIASSTGEYLAEKRHVRLHQLRVTRRRQGLSLRCVAKRMNLPISTVRAQEEHRLELTLSDLYRWQEVLEVPLSELLSEPIDDLSDNVLDRARMLRVMKTARSIHGKATTQEKHELAETLVSQLLQVMPELESIAAWPSVGQRRTRDEPGRIAENVISDDWLSADAH